LFAALHNLDNQVDRHLLQSLRRWVYWQQACNVCRSGSSSAPGSENAHQSSDEQARN